MDSMSWEMVAKKLDRSSEDCEFHYFEHFVINPKIKDLKIVNKNAFRFDKFGGRNETKTKIIGGTMDIEGINNIFLSVNIN